MTRTRRLLVLPLLAALAAIGSASASALAARDSVSTSFFSSRDSSAHWTNQTSADSDQFSMELDVSATGYAGIELRHVPAAPPADPPAYDFKTDRLLAAGGGSPRLVMQFSDGGDMELRPLVWTDQWVHEDGTSTDWDVHSPTCPFLYETTYAIGLLCHAGATVTSAYLVSDSGWLNGPYVNWIDNLRYGETTISQPSDNSNR